MDIFCRVFDIWLEEWARQKNLVVIVLSCCFWSAEILSDCWFIIVIVVNHCKQGQNCSRVNNQTGLESGAKKKQKPKSQRQKSGREFEEWLLKNFVQIWKKQKTESANKRKSKRTRRSSEGIKTITKNDYFKIFIMLKVNQ